MLELQTKYITADDFKNYFGVDLGAELNENPIGFLMRIEIRMESYLNSMFYRNIEREYPKFSDYQKLHYKLALLEQAMYVMKNGDISVDSGYDPEKGEIISQATIDKIAIGLNAKNELILCGLWCRHIRDNGLSSWFEDWWR